MVPVADGGNGRHGPPNGVPEGCQIRARGVFFGIKCPKGTRASQEGGCAEDVCQDSAAQGISTYPVHDLQQGDKP